MTRHGDGLDGAWAPLPVTTIWLGSQRETVTRTLKVRRHPSRQLPVKSEKCPQAASGVCLTLAVVRMYRSFLIIRHRDKVLKGP